VILIGIGSNLPSPRYGPPRDVLAAALAEIAAADIGIATRSAWYRSEPVPRSDQPWFVNAVTAVTTDLGPHDLLAALQGLEEKFGRTRSEKNAARVLDLDLLDHHSQLVETPSLVLPHPLLHERRFVLVPLAEIAPDWRHPRLGLTAKQLLARLGAAQPVEPLRR
jgi:2-amino-4-hydroxy-6-hydroxymethyldihydropteridine diphosphokinase